MHLSDADLHLIHDALMTHGGYVDSTEERSRIHELMANIDIVLTARKLGQPV